LEFREVFYGWILASTSRLKETGERCQHCGTDPLPSGSLRVWRNFVPSYWCTCGLWLASLIQHVAKRAERLLKRLNMTDGVQSRACPDTNRVKIPVLCSCGLLMDMKRKLRILLCHGYLLGVKRDDCVVL
jgi:hypothetical protein